MARTSVTELAARLRQSVEFQHTPRVFTEDDYIFMVKYGIRMLYIDTGRSADFYEDMFIEEVVDDVKTVYFDATFPLDETEYILCVAAIRFYEVIRTSVNEMVSYTTDALSVTQGDKPYANITGSIHELENNRRVIFYKMTRYTIYGEG